MGWLLDQVGHYAGFNWSNPLQHKPSFIFQLDAGWEEYYDYIFPDEAAAQPNLKLLALAKMWKKDVVSKQTSDNDEAGSSGADRDDDSDEKMETDINRNIDADDDSGVSNSEEEKKS